MNRDVLAFKEDLIKEYAQKRIALEEQDVADLLRCFIGYLRQRTKSDECYAIHIPNIGILYKKENQDNLKYSPASKINKLEEKLLMNKALKLSPTTTPPKYKYDERADLQDYCNS